MDENFFGWTTDPAIIAIVDSIRHTEDHELLSNRKDGGVHCVWLYPLGHFDDDDGESGEPIFTRVDIAWGRYRSDGITFLVWEDEQVRAGTLADMVWLREGVNENTKRTQARARNRIARERYQTESRRQYSQRINLEVNPYPLASVFDFAALLPEKNNGG